MRATPAPVLGASVTDTSQLTTSDYSVEVKDVAGTLTYSVTTPLGQEAHRRLHRLPDRLRRRELVRPPAATAQAGRHLFGPPTRTGARDLEVLVRDPAKVAAASPLVTGNTSGNQGSGALSAATVDANYLATPLAATVTLAYDAATTRSRVFGDLGRHRDARRRHVDKLRGRHAGALHGRRLDRFRRHQAHHDRCAGPGRHLQDKKNVGGVSDGSNALLLSAAEERAPWAAAAPPSTAPTRSW